MEIKDFRAIEKVNSPLKATFTVYIPQWDFSIVLSYFEKSDGSSWLGYPQQEWINKEGQKKYKWLAFFGEKGKSRFEESVKKLIKEKLPKIVPITVTLNNKMEFGYDDIPF